MILSFSVSNFRSIYSEQTFSLVSSKRVSGFHQNHESAIPKSKETVLKTAVIYGANGAGKSNLFKALRYMQEMVTESKGRSMQGTKRECFRFNSNAQTEPTMFDLQFIAGSQCYRYGFKVNDSKVLEEWLIKVGSKDQVLFERITSQNDEVVVELRKSMSTAEKEKKLQALATVGGPSNQLFLSTIYANLKNVDLTKDYSAVSDWFNNILKLIAPTESVAMLGHLLANNEDFLNFAGSFLKSSSTGVESLNPNKIELSEEELKNLLPASVVKEILNDLNVKNRSALVQMDDGNELIIERKKDNHFFRIKIQAMHKGSSGKETPLDLNEESDGTRRLLNLMPALHRLKTKDAVFFIDEIDRSMHPILVWKFLEYYLNFCDGGQRQIIVTTHETNLLHLDLLRRDEIWFAEKDENLETHFYSLTDFKVRNDLDIRKNYLQGRFGAIPFMGDLENLPALDANNGVV